MRVNKYILLILCILAWGNLYSQTDVNAHVSITPSADGRLEVGFSLGQWSVTPWNESFDEIRAAGMVSDNGTVGAPALPTVSVVVSLPRGGSLLMEEVVDSWTSKSQQRPLRPVQPASVKDNEPDPLTKLSVYAAPGLVALANLGAMGGHQLWRVTVCPFRWSPASQELAVCTSLSATLAVKTAVVLPSQPPRPERYLVVSRPEFRQGLQPFVQWKRQTGYDVVEVYADTNQRDSVKALISPYFPQDVPSAEWPAYLLLVGDAAQLQAFAGTSYPSGLQNHFTDLYYAEHTGDYLPDTRLGRWPVNDTAELRAVVEKTLRYEQFRDLDTSYFNRILLVAGRENSSPAPITTNGQVNYLKVRIKEALPQIDTACFYNPASYSQKDAILSAIGEGQALINYTAHCSSSGWSNPSVYFGTVDTLESQYPTVYINNCCQSNTFAGTCFGEQLLRKPGGGAIGVIGATNSTLWNEDYYWAVGAKYPFSYQPVYDPLTPGALEQMLGGGRVRTMGDLLLAGNMAVSQFGSPYDRFYWEIYCLFGDPSMMPWLGMPECMADPLLDSADLVFGGESLHVEAIPGSRVSVMQGSVLLGVADIDSTSHATIALSCPLVDSLPLILTSTAFGYRPRVDTFAVPALPASPVLFFDIAAGDSLLVCRVFNASSAELDSVSVTLDMNAGVLEPQQVAVSRLLPQADTLIAFSILGAPIGYSGTLTAINLAGDTLGSRAVGHVFTINLPEFEFHLLGADSLPVRSLESGSDCRLVSLVHGDYDSASVQLILLPSADTLVSVDSIIRFTVPDSLTHLKIIASAWLMGDVYEYEYWIVGGSGYDSFEEGSGSYPWDCSSLRPWSVDSAMSFSGQYSMRSAPIDYRQTSDLELDLLLPDADSISFYAFTSSEESYDKLIFSIDGVNKMSLSGESGWRRYAYLLSAGSHHLRWRYVKDESGSRGSDCAWVDHVHLPVALWNGEYGYMGDMSLLSIEDSPAENNTLKVYPNPASGRVWIDSPQTTELVVFDIRGRVVDRLRAEAGVPVQYRPQLPAGVYMLRAESTGATLKLIISKP